MTAASQITEIISKLTKDNQTAPVLDATSQSFIRDNIFIFTDNSRNNVNSNGWQSFLCLEDDDPNAILAKINTGGVSYKNLVRMTTLEKSLLVPKIQLYKVIIDGDTRKATKEIPITFPDSAKTNISEIINSKGTRGDDIAIKSFTFDFKNQNPYGAGRVVDCNLVLTMLSGESLVKPRAGKFKFSDLIVRNNRLNQERFDSSYYEIRADVGYGIPKKLSSSLKEQLKNNNVSMSLILVDYDLQIQQNGVIQLSLQYRARIQSVTENIIKYNIFRESEIKVDATTKSKLINIEKDIVALDEKSSEHLSSIENIKRDPKKNTTTRQVDPSYTSFGRPTESPKWKSQTAGIGPRSSVLTPAAEKEVAELNRSLDKVRIQKTDKKNAYDELAGEILYLQAKNKIEIYGDLMNNMFQKGKVYRTEMNPEDLLVFGPAFRAALEEMSERLLATSPTAVLTTQQLALESERRRSAAKDNLVKQLKEGSIATTSTYDLSKEFDILAEEIATSLGKPPTNSSVVKKTISAFNPEKYIGLGRNDSLTAVSDAANFMRGKKIIYWFYLGDLLDQAIKMNKLHYELRDDHIIPCVGNFNIRNPRSGATSVKGINIADIPVTIEEFISFFKSNIIEPNVQEYPLYNFIRDITQRLAMPALNVMSFSNPQQQSRVLKVTTFDLPSEKKGKSHHEPLTNGTYAQDYQEVEIAKTSTSVSFSSELEREKRASPGKKFGSYVGRVQVPTLVDGGKLGNKGALSRRSSANRYSYFLFYGSSKNTELAWQGEVDADSKRGVQHFYIGSDRGLIKEINFIKTQRPGLAEMMAERSLRSGNRKVELWRNFEAEISMVGNSLLKPGCFLYINPTVSGMGSPTNPKSLGSIMGLGGYYFVLSVTNVIDNSGWNTRVNAVWQSSPNK
jgi:hypothetical protein|tara:strand:- start:1548 stop:4259 length:2712 start_codon:yes stop_codon:yes gene_type:complete